MTSSEARDAAIRASRLGALPPESLEPLLAGAWEVPVPSGTTLHRVGDSDRHLYLVVAGLLRVSIAARDGRTMTLRYCRPGALLGVATLFVERLSFPATIQALTVSVLLTLRPDVARDRAHQDLAVAAAFLAEVSERTLSFVDQAAGAAFSTVGQRIRRHLLDLASETREGSELMAAISQQDLADAVGSVREVVVRELRALREAGLIATARNRIRILQPEELVDWNEGS